MNTNANLAESTVATRYDSDGFWVAPEVFSPEECETLKEEALRVLKENAKPGASVFVGVAAASAMYYRLADDPRIVSILKEIMPDGVMFLSDKFVFKSGTLTFPTPWHYDASYWPNTRPKLSVWIALDDVTAENGTLKVVRRSHKRDWKHETRDRSQTNNEFVNFIADAQWSASDEIVCEMKRGGAIFFSDRLLHASCPNTSGLDRYAIISTYQAPAEDEPFDKHFTARHVIVPKV